MRKKLLASVLVAAMAITMLAGCGSTDDNTTCSIHHRKRSNYYSSS